MMNHRGLKCVLRLTVAALLLAVAGAGSTAAQEIPFDEAELFFELNNTDGDLGIHAAIDGEPWRVLRIETPTGRRLLNIRANGGMRQQGLTQLMFESAEPTFDELSPEEFFARFPAGTYDITGVSNEGEELDSEAELSQVMAAPASNVRVNGQLTPEDCDAGPVPVVSPPVTVTWDPVTSSHPDIGESGPITVVLYEFVLETDDFKMIAGLPPSVTEFEAPDDYIDLSDEWKLEILVRTETHNNTSVETCFEVD